ncbi:MAG: thioredoxin [Firmicutes bacterium]|nr:thioredoxin [Bacillota bacterium]
MSEITLTGENFEQEVLQSDIPVLVDFWATWCGPCRMLGPVIAQIAEEKAGELKVGKVNVDDEPLLAAEFRVASIPTVMLFRDGKVAAKAIGARPKPQLLAELGL